MSLPLRDSIRPSRVDFPAPTKPSYFAPDVKTGCSLFIGQTKELMRRVLLVHIFRGPTGIFALLLSALLIAGSMFWPTVGMLVISSRESSLIGKMKLGASFPVPLKNWFVGYDGDFSNAKFKEVVMGLLKNLSQIQREPESKHYCGPMTNCTKLVYNETNPAHTNVLYPTNPFYLFIVREIHDGVYGYMTYIPYKTMFSPDIVMQKFLPLKERVDEYFFQLYTAKSSNISHPQIHITVAGLDRDIYMESPERWSSERCGKLFIITVMSAHQYLATACMVVCFASIMCLDKENGFRPLAALMGMRRVSYLTAHFVLCQNGVIFLALLGSFLHYFLGTDLTDKDVSLMDYVKIFGSNVLVSWHQFGLGLILCALTKSTRSVLFPLLALFAMFVLCQLVIVNSVLDDLIYLRESPFDDNGYLIPSYSHSSMHIQILTESMITRDETKLDVYMGMQVLMGLVTMFIGVYLDCVMNTGSGHRFNWDFPFVFCKLIWKAICHPEAKDRLPSIFIKGNTNRAIDRLIEEAKLEFTRVWLKKVTKDYIRWDGLKKKKFRALSSVDLLLNKGEITAILGHNGAGKTTMFSILAGLQGATGGEIRIFGKNPLDAWDAIQLRRITGVCTQFDVLDDRMTLFEHMRLMGAIKGLDYSRTAIETVKLFEELELSSYTNTATSLLPGGDKRKLSVALALLGAPRLIMLDEPTSGVDPFSRRCIWRVLRDYRPNRVIVLITHYMDEADVLADRKAIMIAGRVICYGTSKFLKENYTPGYMLNITYNASSNSGPTLQQMLCERMTGVKFLREFGGQMTYFVEPNAIRPLSDWLFSSGGQAKLNACNVISFGLNVISLEEIFLKLDTETSLTGDDAKLALPYELPPRRPTLRARAMQKLPRPLSIRSWQDRQPPIKTEQGPLLHTEPRSDFIVGWRQFGLLLRVLLGLLVLPTPIYILLRTFLPIIVVGISAVIYHVETTQLPQEVELDWYDYVTRDSIQLDRQHISVAFPTDANGTLSRTVNRTYAEKGLNCYRNVLGPNEPYFTFFSFNPAKSRTGYSVNLVDDKQDYTRRFGSTRVDVHAWNKNSLNITIILGKQDNDLSQRIVLLHYALWNCILGKVLQQTSKVPESTILWAGDFASWESFWPEWHPQLRLGTACVYMIACGVANCILSPLIAGDIVREKELRILKHLHLYGMRHWAYWGAHFFTHIFQYLMLACFTTIVMFPFEGHLLSSWQVVIMHNWINLLAAIDNIMFIYFCCIFFQNAGGATVLFGSTIMIVIFVNITIFFIPLRLLEVAHGCILFFFPFADPFLTLLLTDFRIRVEKLFIFKSTKFPYVPPLWRLLKYNHVKGSQIIHAFRILVSAVVFIGVNVFTHQIRPKRKEQAYYEGLHSIQTPVVENDTVAPTDREAEQNVAKFLQSKSSGGPQKNDQTVGFVYKMTKVFLINPLSLLGRLNFCRARRRKSFTNVAIEDVSFLMNRGEVFGVLGPSGAGKSTLLECLATTIPQDSGHAGVVVNRTNELLPIRRAFDLGAVGYCPQHNPIWPQLTVREHLVVYSVMRDLRQRNVEPHVARLISMVNMERYRDTHAGSLSGGCKRRLSMAIGLVGDPSLMIMDEPSCGVDPRSRRNLWETLLGCVKGTNRGCLITTHFIDEGEMLCDQLAVLVNGEVLSVGTPQRLKKSCGQGLFIEIKIARNYQLLPDEADFEVHQNVQIFTRYLQEQLPNIRLVDRFEDRLCLQLKQNNLVLFKLALELLLKAHQQGTIEDFSICSPTLEQVYFELAKTHLRAPDSLPD